ncbi:MAG: class II D-tagatose-bisphosphate aldolase, non-catalytic subunit, partial [Erysipelothrix sp.]|nr:class II D-tagatose-bisphosphate aldolase, non-catalytic subunit [Erysipelothrix sp.]
TSMRLNDDSTTERLSDETIARRSAILAKSCLQAFDDLKKEDKDAVFPVFIIGSEVPIPGGLQEQEETLQVTSPEDFETTYETFRKVFEDHDVMEVFNKVIAIVVQPGVEFGDDDLFFYDREKAIDLVNTLKNNYETLAFEGHSTDYQTPEHLRQMVEDGVVILKVGPALTFAYREALFALSHIEDYLCEDPSNFIDVLETEMLENPKNWENHYHGNDKELFLKRKFNYSNRARYYLPRPEVQEAITKLMENLSNTEIPMTLLSQYLPYQWRHIKEGKINNNPHEIVNDYVKLYFDDYHYATQIDKIK